MGVDYTDKAVLSANVTYVYSAKEINYPLQKHFLTITVASILGGSQTVTLLTGIIVPAKTCSVDLASS